MATQSTSSSTQVQQKGGTFGTSGSVSVFKEGDYPQTGLGTREALRRFFAQLNPQIRTLQGLNDGSTSVFNLDCDYLSLPAPTFQSDWNALVTSATGVITGNNANPITTFDGKSAWVAYRKDAWGGVDVWLSVTISGAGSASVSLPVAYNPPATVAFATPNFAQAISVTLTPSSTGTALSFNASAGGAFTTVIHYPCATLSPGFTPGLFPLYLKVKTGRTPVACFLAGAKPQTSQDLTQTATGTLGLPLACAWTFMGASTPAADGSKINQIRIDSIPGLVTNQNYVLNFLVFYGQTGSSGGA